MQGNTVPSNSKVVIHFSNHMKMRSNAGMGYVCLGRSERLEDIYIKGDLEKDCIHASHQALEESKRLQTIFEQGLQKVEDQQELFWKVSYLNVRSLRNKTEDIARDNYLMSADIFGLGETHLKPEEKSIKFDGYEENFANFGKGKGVAAFSRSTECTLLNQVATEIFSAIHLRNPTFDVIFVYWSSNCKKEEVEEILSCLNSWIKNQIPTIIMGDVNMSFSKSCCLNKFLEPKGFQQLIQDPTCESGNVIDHIYINKPLMSKNFFTQKCSAYYSDHDVISIYIEK